MGSKESEDMIAKWPVHRFETGEGRVLQLAYDNTIVRTFDGDDQPLSHILYFGDKLDDPAKRAVRIFGRTALREKLISDGFSNHTDDPPSAADRYYYDEYADEQ